MAAEVFGPYRLERLLGRGGMGEVYRAFDTTRKRVVALKMLTPQLAADPAYQARFRAESELAARLRSAHVIPIHDYGEIDGVLFLDMRLVDGEDLSDRLRDRGPLDPLDAVQVISQTASALDAAHAAGLVHRDVKPSNILLSTAEGGGGPGFAYLVDFGIARTIDGTGGLTGTGGIVGSVDYMAPERFEGMPTDRRADVYALACTLFEALTGTKPFPTGTLAVTLYSHLHTPPPRPSERRPGVSPAFDQVIARGMAKDPRHRFGTAGELAAAARAALTAPVPPPQPRPPAPRPGDRGYATTHPGQRPPPGYGQTRTGPPVTVVPPTRSSNTVRNRVLAAVGAAVLVGGGIWAVVAANANPGGTPTGTATGTSGPARPGASDPSVPRVVRVAENLPLNASSGVAIDPSGATYYVSGPSDDYTTGTDYQLKAYTLDGNEPGPKVSFGEDFISGMALSPDGTRLYAVVSVEPLGSTSSYELAVADPATSAVITTVPLTGYAGPIAVSPAGDRVYIGGVNGMEVIDPVAGQSLGNLSVGGSVDGIAFTPDGRMLVAGSSGVKVVDPVSKTVISSINLRGGPSGIALTPDGARALVTTADENLVAYIDLQTLSVTGSVQVGDRPQAVAVTPDGQQALVGNNNGGSVSVIDLATDAVTELNIGDSPETIAISPDGLTGLIVTSSNVVRVERVTT